MLKVTVDPSTCLFCPLTQDAEVCSGSLSSGPSLHLRARLAPSCAPVAAPPSRAWLSQGSSCSSGVVFARSSLQYVRKRTLPCQPSVQTTDWGVGQTRLHSVVRGPALMPLSPSLSLLDLNLVMTSSARHLLAFSSDPSCLSMSFLLLLHESAPIRPVFLLFS